MSDEKKIIVYHENVDNHPECPHGLTLKLSRGIGARRFYACSAYRNKKDCSFFLWEDEKFTEGKKFAVSVAKKRLLSLVSYKKLNAVRKNIFQETPVNRAYCHTCSSLISSKESKTQHAGHDCVKNLSDNVLTHPSSLLRLEEDSKKESQYLFSDSTINAIDSGINKLNIEKIICIGTPTLHENCEVPSILLDLDHRYASFYDSNKFQWFNMSNFHFFSEDGLKIVRDNFSNYKCAIVIDPPFGALTKPIARTIRKIKEKCNLLNPLILFISPYFMEKKILEDFPEFSMLDYKVNYTNHMKFKDNGRKQGSPVRLFSNVSDFPLPSSEGYHYCKICKRWVSEENKHCTECNKCTSKNGATYKHCPFCTICVKPSWEHCETCRRCTSMGHKCQAIEHPFKRKLKTSKEKQSKKFKRKVR